MKITSKISYPNDIDKRSYFSDVTLDKVSIINAHHAYVRAQNYHDAAETAENANVDYYGAYLFNRLEEILYQIGGALRTSNVSVLRPYVSKNPPKTVGKGMVWIY